MTGKWKKTLDLPSTKFPMRANLNQNKKFWQQFWNDHQIYQKLITKAFKGDFILKDGPPYANGDIHLGHVFNKVLKDFVVRLKCMQGYACVFKPGWDGHGLPIEMKIPQKIKGLTPVKKREWCREFSQQQMEKQKQQMLEMNLFVKWDEGYFTITEEYVNRQLTVFLSLFEKGLIYWAKKPVAWSLKGKTALSESEVSYKKQNTNSIYLWFPSEHYRFVVWTTTPYTLEANQAISVHPDLSYAVVLWQKERYVMLESSVEKLCVEFEMCGYEVVELKQGKEFVGTEYLNPVTQEWNKVISAIYVDKSGTGIVHNAPGFGLDDYLVCKEEGISPYCPIGKDGLFFESKIHGLTGLSYKEGSIFIIDFLKKSGHLLCIKEIEHDVIYDWRSQGNVIYLSTEQWFIDLSKLKLKGTFKSFPCWVKNKLLELITQRKEWCISRQRVWGVPIPIRFENEQPVLKAEDVKENVAWIKKNGVESWFSREDVCTDIMDVWFDSGTSFTIESGPADLYLEGSDQLRGWFNSSLILSQIMRECPPFKELISHGFVLNNGEKMSKSRGNVVSPAEVFSEFGDDVVRLWVSMMDYRKDLSYSRETLEFMANTYRKIRNSLFKFSLSVLKEKEFSKKQKVLSPENRYILHRFRKELNESLSDLDHYSFHSATKRMLDFLSFFSSWFIEISKDKLYCGSEDKEETLCAIDCIFRNSLKFWSIFIPQTAEECYSHLTDRKKESVFLEEWKFNFPDFKELEKEEVEKWKSFFKIEEELKNEELVDKSGLKISSPYNNDFLHLLGFGEYGPSKEIEITPLTGLKHCERCRLMRKLSQNFLCERCIKALSHQL